MKYFTICHCSYFEYAELQEPPPTDFLAELIEAVDFEQSIGTKFVGITPLAAAYAIKTELPSIQGSEIEYCLDFLIIKNADGYKEALRDICLSEFITEFLGITNDSYAYLLMNFLSDMNYTDHGCGIRVSWLSDNRDYQLNQEHVPAILKWCEERDETPSPDLERPWLHRRRTTIQQ